MIDDLEIVEVMNLSVGPPIVERRIVFPAEGSSICTLVVYGSISFLVLEINVWFRERPQRWPIEGPEVITEILGNTEHDCSWVLSLGDALCSQLMKID